VTVGREMRECEICHDRSRTIPLESRGTAALTAVGSKGTYSGVEQCTISEVRQVDE
jgi:hypothetical protein